MTKTIIKNNPALIRYQAEQAAFQAEWARKIKEAREQAGVELE